MTIDETVDSSTTTDEGAETALQGSSPAPDATSESSSEKVAKEPSSMLDAVLSVTQKEGADTDADEGTEPAPQSTEGEAEAESEGEGEKPKPKVVSDDLKDYVGEPFHKLPRFRSVLKALREERAGRAEERAWREENEKTVSDFTQFRTNVQNANLTANDVAVAFSVAANMVNDPATALEQLRTIVADLETRTGNRLPNDLQAKLDQGLIDEETALEVSRARANERMALSRSEAVERNSAATIAQRDQIARASAVSRWEEAWKSSDPDYAKKQPYVEDAILALVAREGVPKTEEAAIDLCSRARTSVEGRLASLMPRREAKRMVSGANNGASNSAKPQPKSMLDVVQLNRAGA